MNGILVPRLFKYVKPKTAITILEKKTLQWSIPNSFNDPFEFKNPFAYGFEWDELLEVALQEYAKILTQPQFEPRHSTLPSPEQRNHEKITAEKIVSLCDEATQFVRFGDDKREPDIIFEGKDSLGIEVTLAYFQGDQDDPNLHARELWKLVRNPNRPRVHRIIDPKTGRAKVWDQMIERLQARCQEAIDQKCPKTYQGLKRTWLGIYVDAPPIESHDLYVVANNLVIPSVNPFDRILLLHRANSQYRVLQIFPEIASYF